MKRWRLWLFVGLMLAGALAACQGPAEPETAGMTPQAPVPSEAAATPKPVATPAATATQGAEDTAEAEAEPKARACAPPSFADLGDEGVVKIGVPLPLSAPGAVAAGQAMKTAVQIAADQVNATGGVMGKYPVEPVFYDTAGLPERGAAAMEDLLAQECVVAVVGEYHSAAGRAEKEVAHKYGIPIVFAAAWSDAITAAQYPEVFRIAPTWSLVAQSDAQFFKDLGVTWAALVTASTDDGLSAADATQKQLAALGIEAAIFQTDPGAQDFSDTVARLAQALEPRTGRAAVLVLLTGEDAFHFQQQAVEGGVAPAEDLIFVANPLAADARAFWQNVPDGNYMVFRWVGGGSPSALARRPAAQAFVQQYHQAWQDDARFPEHYAFEAYDAFLLVAQAIEEAQSLKAADILTALEAYDSPENGVPLAQGTYYFPYGTRHPVPDDQPAWMWHQWPEPRVFFLQYWQVGQPLEEACVIWPAAERTCGTDYLAPGTQPEVHE